MPCCGGALRPNPRRHPRDITRAGGGQWLQTSHRPLIQVGGAALSLFQERCPPLSWGGVAESIAAKWPRPSLSREGQR